MVMDPDFRDFIGTNSEIEFVSQIRAVPVFPDLKLDTSLGASSGIAFNENHIDKYSVPVQSSEVDSPDYDFNDEVLKYINHILMEEDVEDKACMFLESAALQSAEKSFYEVLGDPVCADSAVPCVETPDVNCYGESNHQFGTVDTNSFCSDWNSDLDWRGFGRKNGAVNFVPQSISYSSSTSSSTVVDGSMDSPDSTLKITDIFSDSQSAIQFNKGVEEASKFLPNLNNLISGGRKDAGKSVVKVEKRSDIEASRGKKNPYDESLQVERGSKQTAVYAESTVSPDMFDKVLLCSKGKNESDLREALQKVSIKSTLQENGQSNGGKTKGRSKKQRGRKNVVDMRTLLTLCAQAVAADDRRSANELLKQIRQHAIPTGDGMQRLGYYFANGLEARMAGSDARMSSMNFPVSASDILKAYHIYLATCPFRKLSIFFANRTIMKVSEKATHLHIIDFGILYGFQWPCFLQRLSDRPGGPPKLRITGIDLPCPGFRPSQRVEETGRRLASYAKKFNVPFEFIAIAQKWETIKLEDLKIRKGEVLVVNCLFRFRNLLDETVMVNSPRNIVLNLIRKVNPVVFVHGIVNGAYNAPFFITRFREALHHYSSFFDMLDANIPREVHERMLLERTVFGREVMNVLSCEAAHRIERPETYKQWYARNLRAGLEQLPLDQEIVKAAKKRVQSSYHKEFVIDEDSGWLLQGWKGRTVYAISSWKPKPSRAY